MLDGYLLISVSTALEIAATEEHRVEHIPRFEWRALQREPGGHTPSPCSISLTLTFHCSMSALLTTSS